MWWLLIVSEMISVHSCVEIQIDTRNVIHVVDEKYVSVTVDTAIMSRHWERFHPSSTKIKTLAQALSPSYLRFGGTEADLLVFKDDDNSWVLDRKKKHSLQAAVRDNPIQKGNTKDAKSYPNVQMRSKRDIGYIKPDEIRNTNFTMTAKLYDELNKFTAAAGLNLMFDLNSLLRNGDKWNPTNAYKLMEYTVKKGYPIAGWELGNEPDAYYHQFGIRVEPEQRAQDYVTLKQMASNFTAFKKGIILGPSVTQLGKKRSIEYFESFLKSGGGDVVTAADFHQYYVNARTATVDQFIDPDVLNILIQEVITGYSIKNQTAKHAQLWLGETSSAWGGGAEGLSDRYVAGFMWLDKLGVSAKFGVDVVVRQAFYGGHYALIDRSTRDPNPDYWLTLLFKKLVGRKVMAVTSPDFRGKLRSYAHCANNQRTGYKPGSVVVYSMNLNSVAVNLTFHSLVPGDSDLDVYLLQPDGGDILSSSVTLNGTPLKMISDTQLPPLSPKKQRSPVFLPAYTFSFVVIPDANVQLCF